MKLMQETLRRKFSQQFELLITRPDWLATIPALLHHLVGRFTRVDCLPSRGSQRPRYFSKSWES